MSTKKREPLLINFPADVKKFLKSQSVEEDLTMGSFVIGLVKKEQKRVERTKA